MKATKKQDPVYETLNLGTYHSIPVDSDPAPSILHRPSKIKKIPTAIYQRLIKLSHIPSATNMLFDIYLVPNQKDDLPENYMFMSVRKIEGKKNTLVRRQQLGDFRSYLETVLGIAVCTGNSEKFYGIIKVCVNEKCVNEIRQARHCAYVDKYTPQNGYTLDKATRVRAPNKRQREEGKNSDTEEPPKKKRGKSRASKSTSSSESDEEKETEQWMTEVVHMTNGIVGTVISAALFQM